MDTSKDPKGSTTPEKKEQDEPVKCKVPGCKGKALDKSGYCIKHIGLSKKQP